MLRGFIPINKPPGITSFQVIREIKRFHRGKIGHAGTLDPFAAGLLIVLIGDATKLAPFVLDLEKEYSGTIQLGLKTDTYDVTGKVLERNAVPDLSLEAVRAAAVRFLGTIEQRPPPFAALKHQGRKFYELARAGKEVPVRPRPVIIHEFEIVQYRLPNVDFRAVVGRGTYLRSLASDFGNLLGCGATLSKLNRTRIGRITLDPALSRLPSDLETMTGMLRQPFELVDHLPAVSTDRLSELSQGKSISDDHGFPEQTLVSLSNADGTFLAIGVVARGMIRPKRIIHAD